MRRCSSSVKRSQELVGLLLGQSLESAQVSAVTLGYKQNWVTELVWVLWYLHCKGTVRKFNHLRKLWYFTRNQTCVSEVENHHCILYVGTPLPLKGEKNQLVGFSEQAYTQVTSLPLCKERLASPASVQTSSYAKMYMPLGLKNLKRKKNNWIFKVPSHSDTAVYSAFFCNHCWMELGSSGPCWQHFRLKLALGG